MVVYDSPATPSCLAQNRQDQQFNETVNVNEAMNYTMSKYSLYLSSYVIIISDKPSVFLNLYMYIYINI